MSFPWGEQLRAFRLKAGYETLSQFSDALDEIEPVHLDSSTLSRYEKDSKRMPKQRERHLLLAEALVKGGGVESIAELNAWLAIGGLGHLTQEEERRLFPQATGSPAAQPAVAQVQTPTAVSPPPARSRPAASKRPYLLAFAGLASIIAILLFVGSFYIPPDDLVLVPQTPTETATAVFTPTPTININGNLLENDSFEAATAGSWVQSPDCTLNTFALETNRAQAKAGERYLVAATDTADCYSFRQDIPIPATLTGTVSFGIYARAADETARRVTLALWTGTGMGETFSWSPLNNGEVSFLIGGEEWHCLEISLDFPAQRYTTLRAEIYLNTPDGQVYEFDEAWLKAGFGGDCPPASDQLRNVSFESRTAYPWVSLSNCPDNLIQVQVVEGVQEGRQVAVATGHNEDCRSFYQDVAYTAVLSDTYTFSIWGRSPTGNPVQGVIGLWARHDNRAEQGAETRFLIAGQEWHCLEVQLTLTQTRSTSLRPEVYLASTDGTPYEFDQAQLSLQSNSPCPPRPLALRNSSFEDTPLVHWQAHGCVESVLDTAVALPPVDGQQYLVVERPPEAGCISFYQDTYIPITPDETYRYSIWVRSPDGTPRSGRIVLWAIGAGIEEADGHDFTVAGNEWHCLETALTVRGDQYTYLRSEVYLNNLAQAYLFDHALLASGQNRPCPPTDIFPGQILIEGNGSFYAGSSLPFRAELRNGGATSISHHLTRFWVSTAINGEPFDAAVLRTMQHPEIMPPGSNLIIATDVRLPNALTPGDYYLVVEADSEGKLNEVNEENNRHSVPFTIIPCAAGTIFCDVPAGYPGRAEIELWREQGITGGCNRITTENGETLFFCPTEKVLRDILAVVIMRQERGGQYRPEVPAEGLFTDTALDNSLTPWVEALARQGIMLTSDACPSTAVDPRFCPQQVVTKGDLARYLAELLAWELPETADGTFVDVTGSSPEARAITYMAQQGYLVDGVVDCVPEQFPLQEGERAFCADEAVSRGDTAVLMVRAYNLRSTTPEP